MSVKVSVIVPNYNHSDFLQQRLNSVFNQTFKDFEVILLDDASTDGSENILKGYENHPQVSHLLINKFNSGSPFKQWKKGIELAKGDFIWIAESDDYCDEHFLEILLSKTDENTLIYSQSADVDEKGNHMGDRLSYTDDFTPNHWKNDFDMTGFELIKDYMLFKNVIPNASSVIFNKQLYKSDFLSGELLDMKYCGDWFFWIKLCEKANVAFVSQELNFFRTHASVSRIQANNDKRKQRLAEEFFIRSFLKRNYRLQSTKMDRQIKKHWIYLHKVSDLVKKDFYIITSNFIERLFLLGSFLKIKIQAILK